MDKVIISILVFFLALTDIGSGSLVALINHEFTSHDFKVGCIKKFGQIAILIVSMPITELCYTYIGIELPITIAVTTQYIVQEGFSLYENFKKLGGEVDDK